MVWIWKMADFLLKMNLMDNLSCFLKSLKFRMNLEMTRIKNMWSMYVAYPIYMSRNSWIFESRRFSNRFILEHAMIQVIKMIYLEFADLITMILNFWSPWFIQ